MKSFAIHSLSSALPEMSEKELNDLAADIKSNGLNKPIVMFEGKVLDGRHRLRACEIAGVEPRFSDYKGDNPIGFVRSENVLRRHLSTTQRAMFGASLVNAKVGSNQHGRDQMIPTTVEAAAKGEQVGVATMKRARKVFTKGSKALRSSVINKGVALADAAKITTLPKREQSKLAAKGPAAIKAKAEQLRQPARGGLAAEALKDGELAGRKAEARPPATAPLVLKAIDAWWKENANLLNSHPPALPNVVFKEVRRVVGGLCND